MTNGYTSQIAVTYPLSPIHFTFQTSSKFTSSIHFTLQTSSGYYSPHSSSPNSNPISNTQYFTQPFINPHHNHHHKFIIGPQQIHNVRSTVIGNKSSAATIVI